jgi:glycosyltransferase involved in cell wall biosynthesis
MKILHLWKSDYHGGGGGAIAMYRLHKGLREAGFDSWILCEKKTTGSPYVLKLPPPNKIEILLKIVTAMFGISDIYRLNSIKVKRNPIFRQTDLLHIHGTHSGFLNYLALPGLTRNKPTVFTLHDVWPLTGDGSYVPEGIELTENGSISMVSSFRLKRQEFGSKLGLKLKKNVFKKSNMIFISPSRWLTEQAKQSIIRTSEIVEIPHGIDTDVYKPIDQNKCRKRLNLPLDKKILMCMAVNLSSYRKGGDLLIKAIHCLPDSLKSEIILVLVGHKNENIIDKVGIKTIDLGYITSERSKAEVYSAADLFVFPTRHDIFGLVSIESQACGTPVVSFRVDAVPEHVIPDLTGYLAEPENYKQLSQGIFEILSNDDLRLSMKKACRKIAVDEYRKELNLKRHIDLYQQLYSQGAK